MSRTFIAILLVLLMADPSRTTADSSRDSKSSVTLEATTYPSNLINNVNKDGTLKRSITVLVGANGTKKNTKETLPKGTKITFNPKAIEEGKPIKIQYEEITDLKTSEMKSHEKSKVNSIPEIVKTIGILNNPKSNACSSQKEDMPPYDESWTAEVAFQYLRDTPFDCEDLHHVPVDYTDKPLTKRGSNEMPRLRTDRKGWKPTYRWNLEGTKHLQQIDGLVIHHTASAWGNIECDPNKIEELHINKRKWKAPGYHFYICYSSKIDQWQVYELRPPYIQGAHTGARSKIQGPDTVTTYDYATKKELEKETIPVAKNLNPGKIGIVVEGNYGVDDPKFNPFGYSPEMASSYRTLPPPEALTKLGQLAQCLFDQCNGSICDVYNHGQNDEQSRNFECSKGGCARAINCGTVCPGDRLAFAASALRQKYGFGCTEDVCLHSHPTKEASYYKPDLELILSQRTRTFNQLVPTSQVKPIANWLEPRAAFGKVIWKALSSHELIQ